MKRADLMARLREDQIKLVAVETQTDGVKKLYEAAQIMNNQALAETYRQQLHELLDIWLDSKASTGLLAKSLLDASE